MENETYTTVYPSEPRCEERRRPVKYLRVSMANGHAFNGWLVARTAKGQLPALDRSMRSRHAPHVGAKQREKMLGIYRSSLSELARAV